MKGLIKKSKEHLGTNNMSYRVHFCFAFKQGLRCLEAAFYLLIHSVVPGLFPKAGSNLVADLNKVFIDWRKEVGCKCFDE